MAALVASFAALQSNLRVSRLLWENDDVEGCGWFHRRNNQILHVPVNFLRVLLTLVFAPIYLLTPRVILDSVANNLQLHWLLEFAFTPEAVLSVAPDGGAAGQYDVTGAKPKWLLKVEIRGGALRTTNGEEWPEQVPFSEEIHEVGYIALSYNLDSAIELANDRGGDENGQAYQPTKHRKYSHVERRKFARLFLELYCSISHPDKHPNRTEYIWLDEFCILDKDLATKEVELRSKIAGIKAQRHGTETRPSEEKPAAKELKDLRNEELAKMADIFADAKETVIFCHLDNCDHTVLSCCWGKRLFTLAEVLNAKIVWRLKTWGRGRERTSKMLRVTGAAFRQEMQANAARNDNWHLYSIFQHYANSGSVPWQIAIHGLVVEAIRRDEESDYPNHEFLGVALNGLLPRRARPADLGKNDWRDLAWLLELNQGFYNAAGLAAVCSLSDKDTGSWLGKPVNPAVGSERLEPVVTAFPVFADRDPPLAIINCETVAFRKVLLRRDAFGLYTNEEMRPLKILCICLALFLIVIGIILLGSFQIVGGLLLWYFTAVSYRMVELLVSTMYVERDGWVFLQDTKWGEKLDVKLGEQDSHFRTLKPWGSKQMIPEWSAPKGSFKGKLLDLKTCVYTEVSVVAVPNAIVPLAIHGSGVTCMLLERAEDQDKETNLIARKVGMCNLPPYIFAQTVKCGTVYVGPILIPPKC